jgi:hypothetical protein
MKKTNRVTNIVCKRTLVWLTVAILFSVVQIQHSLNRGQLSLPPSYDDVSYFNDALDRLNVFYEKGSGDLFFDYVKNPPHSSISTSLAFIGFLIFGIQDWVPALMNFVVIFAVLLFVDYLGTGLSYGWKIFVSSSSLIWLLMGHAVIEFRPDIFCGLITAMSVILIVEKPWLKISRVRQKVIGALVGLALLIKPVIFPVTLLLIFVAIFLRVLTDRFVLKIAKDLKNILLDSKVFVVYIIFFSAPYFIFGWKDTIEYIYQNQFVDLEKVWGMHALPFVERINYYVMGEGGLMMLKNDLYAWLWIFIIALIIAVYRKTWKDLVHLYALVGTIIVAYAIVTISSHKSPFLGVVFSCFVFFTGIQMLIFVIRNVAIFKGFYKKFLMASIIFFLLISVYFFEWPASNDLVSPNPKSTAERKYYNGLLDRIYDDITVDNDLRMQNDDGSLRKQKNGSKKKIYLSSMAHWVHEGSLNYYQFKLHEKKFVIDTGTLTDDFDKQIKNINASDYILAFGVPSADTPSWLPSVRIEGQVLQFLNGSPKFALINTYVNPYTGAKIFLYANIDNNKQK